MNENDKEMMNEIIQIIKVGQETMTEFGESIFNALVEKIDVISTTHFVFELENVVRVEEEVQKKYIEIY